MVTLQGVLSGVSLAHGDADIETIAAVTPADSTERLRALLEEPAVTEAFVLCTCNRVELYVVTDRPDRGAAILSSHLDDVPSGPWRTFGHDGAIDHLFRVAAGLESQVLGEDEILGQVREAYHAADEVGAIGDVLDRVLLKAVHVGERAREETAINEGVVSLASAAVRCAQEYVHLPTSRATVVGTGDTGTRAARALADAGVAGLTVANRSIAPAEDLAASLASARAVDLEGLPAALEATDVCITATGSTDPVVTTEVVPPNASLLAIDLGQPPDVATDARERASIAYYDLDRLRRITDRTHERRAAAATEVEALVEREREALNRRFKRAQAEAVVAGMRSGADRIKRAELDRARRRLESTDAPPEEVLADCADAIVNAIMAAPTEALRDAAENDDWSTIYSAIRIFDPDLAQEDLPRELLERAVAAEGD